MAAGESTAARRDIPARGIGYDYLHVAIDDATRLAYVEIRPDGRGTTCAAFLQRAGAWLAEHGVRIERAMTDNAFAYRHSQAFQDALTDLAARHKRTRPYRPQTNGKAARFNKAMAHQWAYARVYGSNAERGASLDDWCTTTTTTGPILRSMGGHPCKDSTSTSLEIAASAGVTSDDSR